MTVQEVEKALEEALNSLAQADGELLEEILEKDEWVNYSGECQSAQRSVEEMLGAVRRYMKKK